MHVEIVVSEAACLTTLTSLTTVTTPGTSNTTNLVPEDDMPTPDEIAAAVWRFGIRNGFGVTVEAQQILTAGEKRIVDAQQALAALAGQLAQLQAAGLNVAKIKQAVADALAARV